MKFTKGNSLNLKRPNKFVQKYLESIYEKHSPPKRMEIVIFSTTKRKQNSPFKISRNFLGSKDDGIITLRKIACVCFEGLYLAPTLHFTKFCFKVQKVQHASDPFKMLEWYSRLRDTIEQ